VNNKYPSWKTERLFIRPISDNDLMNVYSGLSHPDVIRYYGVSYRTIEDTRKQMEWYKALVNSGRGIWWAICCKDNKLFYGAAGLSDIHPENHKAELGLWLLPAYWGKGIMQKVVPLILEYCFDNLTLEFIEGFVENKNSACIKALKRLEFTHFGSKQEYDNNKQKRIQLEIYVKRKIYVNNSNKY
jgi:ribosomal-protein-alanine N-acetyltransferase